jgi:tRNA(Leu) C34 or U34 (ribose-2'-O)-methylase TrmL
MVKVAGLWELGWNTPLQEHDLWVYPLRDFGVAEWHMSPVSGIRSEYVKEVQDLPDLLDAERKAGTQVVFLDEDGETDLEDFAHPEDAIYVFGKASMSAYRAYQRPGDLSIKVRTPNNLATLWPHQVAVMVLYDRWRKSWQ